MTTLFFEHPELLWLIAPAIIVVLFFSFRNFIKFRDQFEKASYLRGRRGRRRLLAFTRSIIAILLIVALASPVTIEQRTNEGDARVKLFVDDSRSMGLFDTGAAARLRASLENEVPITLVGTGETSRSAIGDFLLRNMQRDDSILLISDGQNNDGKDLGDVLQLAHKLNASISTIRLQQTAQDAWVRVTSPELSAAGTQTPVLITVERTGSINGLTLTVELDGAQWEQAPVQFGADNSFSLALSRNLPEGSHTVVATISGSDHFPENNVYRAVIRVEPKPNVLFLTTSQNPPILTFLNPLFTTSVRSTLPSDLSPYSTIVIDNMRAEDLPSVSRLTDFIADGKGMVLIGGPSSLDRGSYKGSQIEALLPVSVGIPKRDKNTTPNIAIIIDISGSSGASFSSTSSTTVANVQEDIAIGILRDLKNDTKVAVLAFNDKAYEVAPLKEKAHQYTLEDDILRLNFFGGTLIDEGLRAAMFALAKEPGSKTIILISDGRTAYPGYARKMAGAVSANNIKLFTVGVGEGTDEEFMKELAGIGKGSYFRPAESDRIQLILGAPTNEQKNDTNGFQIVDFNDFITKDLILRGKVNGFNSVVPKSAAKVLVTMADGRPLLTTWRFGLGRVATLSTDDGSSWAPALLSPDNAQLLSRTVFWSVGDPRASKPLDVLTTSGRVGDPVEVLVKADSQPTEKGISFSKIDEKLYSTTLIADQPGFVKLLNQPIAINYGRELDALGQNQEFLNLITQSGGQVFEESDTTGIIESIKQHAQRAEVTSVSWAWVLLVAALVLFFLEILLRRVGDSGREK